MATARNTRRDFLKTASALTGGLVIGFYLPGARNNAFAQAAAKPVYPPNAFLRIGSDNSVTVMVKHLEFGQGVMTSLPMLVAEELECDWTKVRSELAPAAPVYAHTAFGMQMTGGSSSVNNSWDQMRIIGAQARSMLIEAAARKWKVKASECRAAKGFVLGPGGKKASFGELAAAANELPLPENVVLKDAKDFRIIGRPTRRIDAADKVNGKARFGLDMKLPNLHTAVVAHPPVFGASIVSFNAEKVKTIPGITHVVKLSTAIAVVAKNFWAAKRGRDALEIEWDLGPNAALSSAGLKSQYAELAKTPGMVARAAQNPDAIRTAARTISAEYDVPFLAHAAMEPLSCTIHYQNEKCEIWVGSQFQTADQAAAARVLELKPEQVKLNTLLAGGGFGRRANPASDYIVEAAKIAKEVKVPVKVVWTREDDIKGGYYRPMYVHRVDVGLDAGGALVGWNHCIVGQSILAGTAFEQYLVKNGVDSTSVEGVADTPYDLPNLNLMLHSPKSGIPSLWWRSVGHTHTAFVMETMLDEIAAATGKDALALRRVLLARQPRVLATLNLAAEKAGWGRALPAGRARGLAVHESFGSVCAQVAEVSIEKGEIRVHRVVAAIDCGIAVNPLTIEAQVQSAIAYGLSAALYGAITLKDGRVEQSNFNDYPVLRIDAMPRVEVHVVPSTQHPSGVGEPGTPPIAPAVANALFALTGKRVRSLPIRV